MSNEQPVKFARRNLFKTAVAGAATVAAGGLSVAQAAAPKAGWDEGTKNGPDRSALLGHNFVYQETKPHGFYSSYFHQRISS